MKMLNLEQITDERGPADVEAAELGLVVARPSRVAGDIFEDSSAFFIRYDPARSDYYTIIMKDRIEGRVLAEMIKFMQVKLAPKDLYQAIDDVDPELVLDAAIGLYHIVAYSDTHVILCPQLYEDMSFELRPRDVPEEFSLQTVSQIMGDIYSDRHFYYFGVSPANPDGYLGKVNKHTPLGKIFMEMKDCLGINLALELIKEYGKPFWDDQTNRPTIVRAMWTLMGTVNTSKTHVIVPTETITRPDLDAIESLTAPIVTLTLITGYKLVRRSDHNP